MLSHITVEMSRHAPSERDRFALSSIYTELSVTTVNHTAIENLLQLGINFGRIHSHRVNQETINKYQRAYVKVAIDMKEAQSTTKIQIKQNGGVERSLLQPVIHLEDDIRACHPMRQLSEFMDQIT